MTIKLTLQEQIVMLVRLISWWRSFMLPVDNLPGVYAHQ